MDDALLARVIDRLDADDALDPDVQILVLAACEGDEAFADALEGGTSPERPATPVAPEELGEPPGTYLGSVTVEGFRGIGSPATLELAPGVGLTLVVGRNGSGKSSFAEAIEVLLTGDNQRWAAQSRVWKEGWRNLHHGDRRISATFPVEGRGQVGVIRTWESEATEINDATATAQAKGERRGALDDLGWRAALTSYRPFLSYNELGRMLDEGPSLLFDALSTILGLEEIVQAQNRIANERRSREKRSKAARDERRELFAQVEDMSDERAISARALLEGGEQDLDALEELVLGAGEPDDEAELSALRRLASLRAPLTLVESAEVSDRLREAAAESEAVAESAASVARDSARLLREAMSFHSHHGGADCPVCGTADVLDASWRQATEERLVGLDRESEQADRAAQAAKGARAQLRAALTFPSVTDDGATAGIDVGELDTARSGWLAADPDAALRELAEHVESRAPDLIATVHEVTASATAELHRREDVWRPVAARLAAWVEESRAATASASAVSSLKAAEAWLKDTAADLRTERFAPLATRTKEIWTQLRSQSNVELVDVVLAGSATQRRVEVQVTVDGVEGAALGVMSQGELHSLALSLFFPRATLGESPFRFVVIDDPVQSMDPVRVDGLARVLEEVAKSRQVVVFTHDDRLPQSVRQLGIEATILEVTRRAESAVEVREALDPVYRYIQDSWALLNTEDLPTETAARVVPGFCRLALEAAFLNAYRRRELNRGTSHAEVEASLERADKTSAKAALCLFGDVERAGNVMSELNRIGGWAGTLFKNVQAGSHTKASQVDLEQMVKDTKDLARRVVEKYG